MNEYLLYGIIAVLLFVLEVVYFRLAAYFNIIDRPNERSSHSSIVLRGGGIIFLLGVWIFRISLSAVHEEVLSSARGILESLKK